MKSPSRRTLLAAGTLALAGLLAACSGSDGSGGGAGGGHKADPDLPIRSRAVAASDTLLTQYDALLAGAGATDARLRPLRAEVAQQRAALAVGLPASAAAKGSASPSPAATAPGAAPGAAPTVALLAAAELSTAQARLTDLDAASPELARLLASVSAADALHAALLGDPGVVTVPVTADPSPAPASASASASPTRSAAASATPLPASAVTALQAALAAEHAAVYGYGVIAARTPVGPQREQARAAYAAHEARRDAWHRNLAAGGATPAAAAPGYQLPFAVPDAAAAGRLAAYIETRLTAVYADLVADTGGSLRMSAATALRESVLRGSQWGAAADALPGMPAAPPSPAASPSVSPSASPRS